jgi:hypothetical protein
MCQLFLDVPSNKTCQLSFFFSVPLDEPVVLWAELQASNATGNKAMSNFCMYHSK